MQNIEDFIDQLITDHGSSDLADEVRQELKADLLQRLLDQIDQAAINALPEDKAVELSNKLDDPNFSQEDLQQFMQDSGVNLQQVALETMMRFRSLYLGEKV